MYIRSPHCYVYAVLFNYVVSTAIEVHTDSKPKCNRTKPCFDDYAFLCMYFEANRRNIPKNERYVCAIFDGLAIRIGIQIDKDGDVVEI